MESGKIETFLQKLVYGLSLNWPVEHVFGVTYRTIWGRPEEVRMFFKDVPMIHCFNFSTAITHRADGFPAVMSKFMFIKVGLSPSEKNFYICFNESPLKKLKNGFYFILKALFILKIFRFFSCFFGHVDKTTWLEI